MTTETAAPLSESPIEAVNVSVVKGHHLILNDVSFRLQSGRFIALVGPSGSGKTSLLRVLSLLDTPAGGTLRFWGHEPRSIGSPYRTEGHRFYPAVSYVPQTLALWPHMTLLGNILFAANGSAQLCENLEYLCDSLEITAILDRKPAFVSQGQRQRCALARALLLQPKLLFLDEITAALDEQLARKVWQLLREFAESGTTIFASTHSGRLASACDYYFQIRECRLETQFHEQYK